MTNHSAVFGLLCGLLAMPACAARYDINHQTYISCISVDSSAQTKFAEYEGPEKSNRIHS